MLELRTLGVIDLRGEDGARIDSVLRHAKRLSLLAYLCATYPPRLHRRDTLVALLWPELDAAHARGALRQELSQLRRALSHGVVFGDGSDCVGVAHELLWCDVQAFERAIDEERSADALALWHGAFLPGLHVSEVEFGYWLDSRRSRLQQRAQEAAR